LGEGSFLFGLAKENHDLPKPGILGLKMIDKLRRYAQVLSKKHF